MRYEDGGNIRRRLARELARLVGRQSILAHVRHAANKANCVRPRIDSDLEITIAPDAANLRANHETPVYEDAGDGWVDAHIPGCVVKPAIMAM